MNENTISFEKVIFDLATKGKSFVAGGHMMFTKVLSAYIMDIPIYKTVISTPEGKYKEYTTLEELDLDSLFDEDFFRCAQCGNFPAKYVWTMEIIQGDNSEKYQFCSFLCWNAFVKNKDSFLSSADTDQNTMIYIRLMQPGNEEMRLEKDTTKAMIDSMRYELEKFYPQEEWEIECDYLTDTIQVKK